MALRSAKAAARPLVLATLVAAAACGGPSALLGPDAAQGIEGLVLLGPTCPVASAENPCPDQPYAAWIDVLDAGGGRLARVRSGADGRFRLGLEPGLYTLHPEPGDPLPRTADQQVRVAGGAWVSVTVTYDTGIR